jgi:hypothetical protein
MAYAIGVFMARMHALGAYALDFLGGNILVDEDGTRVQIVDVNRMRWYKSIGLRLGCRQTERLHLNPQDCQHLTQGYADTHGYDATECLRLIMKHHLPL